MATKEFIMKRIEGAEKNLTKLTKKLERIRKVESQNWEDPNPYYYCERDLKDCLKDIEEAQNSLTKYQNELKVIIEKESSRNVQVIIEFLNIWKERVTEFYIDSLPKWIEARTAYYEADHKYCEEFNSGSWRKTGDKTKLNELKVISKKAKERFNNWKFLNPYIIGHTEVSLDMDKIEKDLQHEADCKYDDIIERTNEICGEITNADNLSIGAKGDLNGFIIGKNGTAKVETIGAGGYNIQCYHFRTLIHKM